MTGEAPAALPASALARRALAWYRARGGRGYTPPATNPAIANQGTDMSAAATSEGAEIAPSGTAPPVSGRDTDIAFHRLVADDISDVLMRLDDNWGHAFVSLACVDVFGYRVEEILALPALELVHPDDRDGLRQTLSALCPAAPVRGHTWRGVHRDGHIVWIEARYRHIPEDGGAAAILRDVTECRQADERLRDAMGRIERLPATDPVSGLPNEQVFATTVARLLTEDPGLAVLRIAQYGRRDGTGVGPGTEIVGIARDMARRLTAELVREPIVSGFGPAGFAVAMRCADGDPEIAARARDLLRVLGAPFRVHGQNIDAAVAIGIAVGPRDGPGGAALMDAAGLALDRARDVGPGSYRFYEAAMGAAEARRLDLRAALPAAIAAGQIVPWYQPIVRLSGGAVCAVEVLARWIHPELGLLEPAEFVSLAEDIGASGDLLRAVLRRACAAGGAWPTEVGLSVNLSSLDVQDTALPGDLAAILAETGFDGTRLEMEIREEGLNLDSHAAHATMDGLRLLGVSLALDDFGTGHSDLSLLRELPLDKVKVDGCLVRPLARGSENNRFFRAVVQMSHAMGLEVVAKGIETEATLDIAGVLGCTYGQGDWIRPPAPAPDLSPARLGSRE